MNEHRHIEDRLSKARIALNDRVNRAVLQDLLDQWGRTPARTSEKPGLRRKIMSSKVSKIAAVAIVLVVVGTGILHIGTKDQGVALGAVEQAICEMPWIHAKTTVSRGDQIQVRQEWECFNPKVHIWIDPEGVISYRDYSRETAYVYQPETNTITISATTDRFNKKGPQSPAEAIKDMIARFQSKSGEIHREKATLNQVSVEVVHLADEHQDISLFLDLERQIPLKMDMQGRIPESDQEYKMSVEFDYPIQGPADIYDLDLGVPANAKVVDNRPQGDVQDLIEKVQQRYDTGFGDHTALILGSWVADNNELEPKDIIVLRQKGNLKRVDNYHAYNFTGSKSHIPTLYPLIKDRWPNLTVQDAIALEDNKYGEFQLIFDGDKSTKRTNFSGKVHMQTIRVDMFQMGGIESLANLAWCNPSSLLITGSDQQIKPELLPADPNHLGWVGLRLVRSMHDSSKRLPGTTIRQRTSFFWFDPERDYLLMERKTVETADEGTGTSVTRIIETAQAGVGKWYPTLILTESAFPDYQGKISRHVEQKRILLDTKPVFKDGVFDGASLE